MTDKDADFIPHSGSPEVTGDKLEKLWREDPLKAVQLLRKNFEEPSSVAEDASELATRAPAFPVNPWGQERLAEWEEVKKLIMSPECVMRRDGRRALPLSAFQQVPVTEVGELLLKCLNERIDTDLEAFDLYHTGRQLMLPGHLLEYAKTAMTKFPLGSNVTSFAYDVALFEEGVDWLLEQCLLDKQPESVDAMVNALARAVHTGGPWFWSRYERFMQVVMRLGPKADVLQKAIR